MFKLRQTERETLSCTFAACRDTNSEHRRTVRNQLQHYQFPSKALVWREPHKSLVDVVHWLALLLCT